MSDSNKILCEHNGRYMRRVHCAPTTVRYEIRERRSGDYWRDDVLIFWTHSPVVAQLHWDKIKDMPVRRKKTDWIEW